jgi:short-subunit dehydrogenase
MASGRMKARVTAATVLVAGAGFVCGRLLARRLAGSRERGPAGLHGKVVLITGASRGLGLALAEEFGKRGAKLALNARDAAELEGASARLLELRAAQREDIFTSAHDLRRPEEAEKLVQEATARFGRIDILVNNAGVITVGPVENQNVQDFRDVMDANFFSGVHCTLAAMPQMLRRRSGRIVNVTSIGGKVAVPHLLPYTASKFAAVGFSEGLNAELRSKGIRVTTVCPGLMRTGSHLNAIFTGDAAREYRWFSLAAGLPIVSTSARSAARKIVRAVISGKSEIAITPQAIVAARLADICPTATMRLMQMMNHVLPSPVSGVTGSYRGAEVRDKEVKPAVVLAEAAAGRYNQLNPRRVS